MDNSTNMSKIQKWTVLHKWPRSSVEEERRLFLSLFLSTSAAGVSISRLLQLECLLMGLKHSASKPLRCVLENHGLEKRLQHECLLMGLKHSASKPQSSPAPWWWHQRTVATVASEPLWIKSGVNCLAGMKIYVLVILLSIYLFNFCYYVEHL